jgi:hypothetical protein
VNIDAATRGQDRRHREFDDPGSVPADFECRTRDPQRIHHRPRRFI